LLVCGSRQEAQRKQNQPQVAHAGQQSVEGGLGADLSGQQGIAIPICFDRQPIKSGLPTRFERPLDGDLIHCGLV